MNQYTIGLLVRNGYGVLSRISIMFTRRGFNIHSLTVGETDDPAVSRMTITVSGTDHDREQIIKQIAKLHDVLAVREMPKGDSVSRELVMIKVAADKTTRQEILNAAQVFRAKVIDYSTKSMTLEITGDEGKAVAFIELMKDYGLLELARTGMVSVARGEETLQ